MTGGDFAALLRQLRNQARLTQEELAERAAISWRAIQDLEEGRHRTAHKHTAQQLAAALGLPGPAAELFVRAAAGRARPAAVLAAAPAPDAVAQPPAQRPVPVPRELPAGVGQFTGRGAELAALDGLLPGGDGQDGPPGPVVISAVSGTAGAGKTALAVHWAHRAAAHFPDGQLYVNLRGFDPDQPVAAEDVLAGFLTALGSTGADMPQGLAARAARYRSLLAGRRLLVLLDNAATEEQVRPLLPGSPPAMALVTSRASLPGLVARDGARRLELGLLPGQDAAALLRALIGDRVDADPAAAQELASLCARLPLALRVAAELAATSPDRPLAELVDELADERDRLDLLDAGGDPRGAVASVLSWSYRHLPSGAARTFRLLGLHPGQDFDAYSAAALAGTTLGRAAAQLAALARAHLIEPARGRYGMHDLLRAYAAGRAAAHDDAPARHDALTRLFDYYLAACAAAMDQLSAAERHHRPDPPPVGTPVPAFADPGAARSWLDAELATLVAVAVHAAGHGWPGHTVGLAQTLHRYFDNVHDDSGVTICRHAVAAAAECGDLVAQARTLTTLGVIYGRQGDYQQAAGCHTEAIALARQAGDRLTQAWALGNLALIHDQQARYPQAARCHRQTLALCRELGDVTGEAVALTNLGLVSLRQGRYKPAVTHLRQAIGLYRQAGHRFGEAVALTNLGQVHFRLGDYPRAAQCQEQALATARAVGSPRVEAWALTRSGEVSCRLGARESAAASYQRALELFREVGDRDGEGEALNGTGENLDAGGQHDRARHFHHLALTLTRQTGGKREQARALAGLGRICYRQGHHELAARYHQDALALYQEIGEPGGQAEALNDAGQTWLATGHPAEAAGCHQGALALAVRTGDRYQQARAHQGLAACHTAGPPAQAKEHWRRAVDLYAGLGVPEADQLRALPEVTGSARS